MTINFEQDRVESVTQIDAAKTLSDKVLKLKDLEDEIANAEESINKLNHESIGLRADLDDLRSQMVDLDKRKSHLEVMIQGLN